MNDDPANMKVVVTAKFIADGQSARGGWSKRQFAILGIDWPPKPGWRQTMPGREIDAQAAQEFLDLKSKRLADP